MMSIYIVLITYIYGTFEKDSQWRGASTSSGHIYTIYTYIYISQTLTDAKFNVESDGMVYLTSKGRADTYIFEKRQK